MAPAPPPRPWHAALPFQLERGAPAVTPDGVECGVYSSAVDAGWVWGAVLEYVKLPASKESDLKDAQ